VRPCVEDVFVFDYWAYDERWMAAPPRRGALRHMVAYSFDADTPEEERLTRMRKRHSPTFYTNNDPFTKTGSGQS
jgi:hypothetical protein